MKKYFIHLNGASKGPYSLEDLRVMRIQAITPIWYDGLGDWRNAGEIGELRSIFSAGPQNFSQPPVQSFSKPSSRSNFNFTDDNLSGNVSGGSSKNKILFVFVGVALALAIGAGVMFFLYQQHRAQKLQAGNELYDAMLKAQEESHPNDSLTQSVIEEALSEVPASIVYVGKFDNYSGGLLTVAGDDDKHLQVTLIYNSSEGCKGEISGDGILMEENKIQIKTKDGCKLALRYSNGFVTVEESPACGKYHGENCIFDGIYSKQK